MTTVKRDIDLSETLGEYLSYTPTSTETHEFLTDLKIMNHTLLRDAILECMKAKKPVEPEQTKRHLIHLVYTRKTKELSALYPFLFATENALRGAATQAYFNVFKDPFWWRKITKAVEQGKTAVDFALQADGRKRIGTTPVNVKFIEACFYAVNHFGRKQREYLGQDNCPASRFLEEVTLKSLSDLISSDFLLCPIGQLKKKDFQDHMRTICDARNELFHGRPIKNRGTLSNACETILDAVDFHLGDFDEALRTAKYSRTAMQIPRAQRHLTPPKLA